jgi:hypothetical protein
MVADDTVILVSTFIRVELTHDVFTGELDNWRQRHQDQRTIHPQNLLSMATCPTVWMGTW